MFRQVIIFLLILTTLTANCSRFFVFAGFELNKNYIVNNLCKNRNKPYLHCNGKCYFMKKIKQAKENEKKQEGKDSLNRLEISFFQEPFQFITIAPIIPEIVKSNFTYYKYSYSSSYLATFFRPPKQVV